jgi:hypothetical protein
MGKEQLTKKDDRNINVNSVYIDTKIKTVKPYRAEPKGLCDLFE